MKHLALVVMLVCGCQRVPPPVADADDWNGGYLVDSDGHKVRSICFTNAELISMSFKWDAEHYGIGTIIENNDYGQELPKIDPNVMRISMLCMRLDDFQQMTNLYGFPKPPPQ